MTAPPPALQPASRPSGCQTMPGSDNAGVNWTIRESVRARLQVLVRPVLRTYGYPPDQRERQAGPPVAEIGDGQAEALRRLASLEPLRMSPLEALSELIALVELATGAEKANGR